MREQRRLRLNWSFSPGGLFHSTVAGAPSWLRATIESAILVSPGGLRFRPARAEKGGVDEGRPASGEGRAVVEGQPQR